MTRDRTANQTEAGFMLIGLIVAIFLILLVLGIAAPRLARSLRRDREVESVHRARQYVRALQLFYRKTGHYPGSLDQLENTNNIRFLRQRYADPITGKADWRLIHVGEAKTTVKGFFGKPLAGLPGAGNLGSAAGMASGAQGTAIGSPSIGSPAINSPTFGSPSTGTSPGFGSPGMGSPGASSTGAGGLTPGGSPGASGSPSPGTADPTASSSGGISSQSATSFGGGGAPIVGISSLASGTSILVVNEQTTYPTWEFLYDPRIEQLKAANSIMSGGTPGTPASSFGTPIAAPTTGASPVSPSAPTTPAPAPPQ